ncbi:MAG: two-component regulator propeller domain-containing protein [Flavobacteriales bacterium]
MPFSRPERFLLALPLCLLVLFCRFSFAQVHDFRNYSVTEGMAESQVFDVFQDSRGYIWFGTFGGGVSRYDGKHFKTFSTTDGLSNNIVFDIKEGPKGGIWFATFSGLNRYRNGEFTAYKKEDGLSSDRIRGDILFDGQGGLWLGTSKGLNKAVLNSDGNLDTVIKDPGHEEFPAGRVGALIQGKGDRIWIGTEKGVLRYEDGQYQVYDSTDGLSHFHINALHSSGKDSLWIGTMGGGLNLLNPSTGKVRTYSGSEGLKNPKIYAIVEDELGRIWVATEGGGVNMFRNGRFVPFTQKNGLTHNVVVSGAKDREGNLWFGTNGGGVSQYRGGRFVLYPTPSIVMDIGKDPEGRIWFATYGNGAFQLNKGMAPDPLYSRKLDKADGLITDRIWNFLADEKGRFWINGDGGIVRWENGRLKRPPQPPGQLNWIHNSLEDEKGRIWLARSAEDPVCRFSNGSYNSLKELDPTPIGTNDICQDERGYIWISSTNGIYRIKGKQVEHFDQADGLPGKRINTLDVAPNGDLWFGAQGEGLIRYDRDSFSVYTTEDGLSGNNIAVVHFSRKGHFWVGTNKGLNRIRLDEKGGIKKVHHYGEAEGFRGLECQQDAIYEEKDGSLWFGTLDGAIKYEPELDRPNKVPPKVHITGVRLFLEEADWDLYSDSIDARKELPIDPSFPYDKNHITFDFTGISHTIPEQVKYRFKLEGLEEEWSPPVDQRFATYSSLPPGEYTFKVTACNDAGVWREDHASYSLTIRPPFWRTWWFYGSSASLLILGAVAFVKVRERNLKRNQRILAQKVNERTEQVVAQKEEIEEKNREITDSIHYASRIQGAILTSERYLEEVLDEHFILFKPKEVVSGDFYWAYADDEHSVWLAADCTGHGVPGAFMSMIGNRLFNEVVLEQGERNPGRILERVRDGIAHALGQSGEEEAKDGMDAALCVLDHKKGVLNFAGANNPLYIIRREGPAFPGFETRDQLKEEGIGMCLGNEGTEPDPDKMAPLNSKGEKAPYNGIEVRPDKQAVGAGSMEPGPFTTVRIPVRSGDLLYTFSDGFADQFGGPKGKKFRYGPFKRLLLGLRDKSMEVQKEELERSFEEWKNASSYDQIDDVLVVGVQV